MKVVLFCGGLGTRLREFSETIPKPMVDIGNRPIIWHIMKYYAHYGHKDFILCLGHRSEYIKKYFLNYDECISNDFVLLQGGKSIQLANRDIADWKITFVDTGIHSNIAQRLQAVAEYLDGEDVFLANYGDGLADLDFEQYLRHFEQQGKIASFLCVRPSQSFHVVSMGSGSLVANIEPVDSSDLWINGGYFIFRRDIFDYIEQGEELVTQPFHRLIAENQLVGYRHHGFWACMDTLKEKTMFDEMCARGEMPWAVWNRSPLARRPAQLEATSENQTLASTKHPADRLISVDCGPE